MIQGEWDNSAKEYSKIVNEELITGIGAKWKDYVLEEITKTRPLHILDIGTGPGIFPILLSADDIKVTGIDLSPEMIEQAKNNLKEFNITAELHVADAAETRLPDEAFDVIICRNLTWTLERPKDAYREWHRLLKPGGELLIFDGEWYSHHYHTDRRERFNTLAKDIKMKYNIDVYNYGGKEHQTDHAMMNHLYLSDKRRPAWDIRQLEMTGFSIETIHHDYLDSIIGQEERLLNGDIVPVFFIKAKK